MPVGWPRIFSITQHCMPNHDLHNLVAFNTLRPRQNGRYFADDIFKCIILNKNAWIALKISLKFVPSVRIKNISALVQIMVWRRPGDKPLSEPMMVSLLTHICVTRPQWVNVFCRMHRLSIVHPCMTSHIGLADDVHIIAPPHEMVGWYAKLYHLVVIYYPR